MTGVKDQGQCGSCWAFATVASLESAWYNASGELQPMSEMQLLDCGASRMPGGPCGGGVIDDAMTWAEGNAMCTEDSHPYVVLEGILSTECPTADVGCDTALPRGAVTEFHNVEEGTEDALAAAVALTPVAVAINATTDLMHYKSGVYGNPECTGGVNHGVTVVGYSDPDGYWRVKNSWGDAWGERGYFRLQKGSTLEHGMCEIAAIPT